MKITYFGMPENELVKIMQQGGSEQMPTEQGMMEGANSNPACAALQQALPNLPAELQTPAKNALQSGQCEQFIQMLQQQAQGDVNTQQAPMMAGGGKDYSVYFGMPESQLEKIQNLAEHALAIIAQSGVKENLRYMREVNKAKRQEARERRKEARQEENPFRKWWLRQKVSEMRGTQYTLGDKLNALLGVNLEGIDKGVSLLDAILGTHDYKNKKSENKKETEQTKEENTEMEQTKNDDDPLKKTIQDKLMEKVNENGTSKGLMDFIRDFKVEMPKEELKLDLMQESDEKRLFKMLKEQNPDLTYREFLETYRNEKPKEEIGQKEVIGEGELFRMMKKENPDLTYDEFVKMYMNEEPRKRAFKDADNSLENKVKQSNVEKNQQKPQYQEPQQELEYQEPEYQEFEQVLNKSGSQKAQIYQGAIEQFANKLNKRFAETQNNNAGTLLYDLITDAKRAGDNEEELYNVLVKIIMLDERTK